uniref:Uncharacterized protein n=1 Tax=Syphacia muris TaxID=451379 RepID=A0A0N5B0M5_9BILA
MNGKRRVIDGWMDGWMDGGVDGWKDGCCFEKHKVVIRNLTSRLLEAIIRITSLLYDTPPPLPPPPPPSFCCFSTADNLALLPNYYQ